MKLKSNNHSRIAALLCGAAAAAWAAPACAQSKGAEVSQVEEVVVTGSLFKTTEKGSQLVTTVSAEELNRTGATSAVEALRTIAQNQAVVVSSSSSGSGTGFASYANLRSLGSESTLVLFDSRRLVNSPYQSRGVDLNTIPLNLVERVETLADGASSIYGSDAIAGVINFIPRREMTGLSVSATRRQPEKKGGDSTQFSISGGIGDLNTDGWNIYGGYTWHKQEGILGKERSFSRTNYIPERGGNRLQPSPFPANYGQNATGLSDINPSAPNCLPPFAIYIGGTGCRFDYAPENQEIPDMEDQSVLLHATGKAAGQTFTLEYLRGWSDIVSSQGTERFRGVVPPNSPFFPGNGIVPGHAGLDPTQPIQLRFQARAIGAQLSEVKPMTQRLLGQVEGEALNWNYQLWGLYSESTVDYYLKQGALNINRFKDALQGINAPFLNPFGPQTAAGLQFMKDNEIHGKAQHAKGELSSVGGQLSRELFNLPAGPVKFALAADYKEESSSFEFTQAAVDSQFFGGTNTSTPTVRRKSYAVTSEVRVPIIEGLDLDASLRYDHSNDFGGTLNPKVLLTWKVNDSLKLRGSYNTGFRAPTLYDVGAPSVLGSTSGRDDPVLCPGGVVNTAAGGEASRDCAGGAPLVTRSGGNPDLGPEQSEAFSLGLEFRPTSNLTISADYWNYHVKDTIAALNENAIYADLPRYGDLIVRCSKADPTLQVENCEAGHSGDPIAYLEQVRENLGDTKTDGIDLNVFWDGPETSWGRPSLDYHGTYVINYRFQHLPGEPFISRAGRYIDGSVVVDYSHYVALSWRKDDWTVALSNRFKSGYTDCNAQCDLAPQFFRKTHAYSLWDLSGTIAIGDHATVTGRITNLFDTDPPYTNQNNASSNGWDERIGDPVGRAYSLTVKYDF